MPLKRENYVYQLSEVHLCDIGFKKGFKKYEYYKVAYYLPMFSCNTLWHEAFKNYYFFDYFLTVRPSFSTNPTFENPL